MSRILRKLSVLNVAIALLMTALSETSYAEVTLKSYQAAQENPETKKSTDIYLFGVGRGIFWAAIYSGTIQKHPILCFPPDLRLDQQGVVDIFQHEVRVPSRIGLTPYESDESIEMILFFGMLTAFHCK